MKLNKYQEVLLRKIVDFSTLQNYDSEEIRRKLYTLFFEWNREVVRKAAGRKDDRSSDDKTVKTDLNSIDAALIETQKEEVALSLASEDAVKAEKHNAMAEEDKEEKKKAQIVRMD